jgi:uncharacterized 2Fe-2S/4Fe-4S cluster protein (DUF4445 family)
MSRVEFALRGGQVELQRQVREQLGGMASQLVSSHAKLCPTWDKSSDAGNDLNKVIIVGNTVMHHLFCGVGVAPLAGHPFEPQQPGRFRFSARELGWNLPEKTVVEFLPCIGGFVGSDILAGIVAIGLHESRELTALMDLGTNGEVRVQNGSVVCRVIGDGAPRGLCGSGLVDAVAAGLEQGWIRPDGRLTPDRGIPLAGAVTLSAADVRELQLAKGAIAAGLRMLAARFGASLDDIHQLHLAGAFGNYVNRTSAQRIGLLRVPINRVVPAGNTALLGAKRALFEDPAGWDAVARRVEHVALNKDKDFHDTYAEEMRFPA